MTLIRRPRAAICALSMGKRVLKKHAPRGKTQPRASVSALSDGVVGTGDGFSRRGPLGWMQRSDEGRTTGDAELGLASPTSSRPRPRPIVVNVRPFVCQFPSSPNPESRREGETPRASHVAPKSGCRGYSGDSAHALWGFLHREAHYLVMDGGRPTFQSALLFPSSVTSLSSST